MEWGASSFSFVLADSHLFFFPFLFLILWWSRNCRPFFFRRVIEPPSSSIPLKYLHTFACVCAVSSSTAVSLHLFCLSESHLSSYLHVETLCGGQNQPPSRARPPNERTNERKRKNKRGEKKAPAIVFDSSKVILFNSQSWKTINHSSASPRSIIVYALYTGGTYTYGRKGGS